MQDNIKYYLTYLNTTEHTTLIADVSWINELKNNDSIGCRLMLSSAMHTLTVSILHSNICGDSNKQLSKILVLVAI